MTETPAVGLRFILAEPVTSPYLLAIRGHVALRDGPTQPLSLFQVQH